MRNVLGSLGTGLSATLLIVATGCGSDNTADTGEDTTTTGGAGSDTSGPTGAGGGAAGAMSTTSGSGGIGSGSGGAAGSGMGGNKGGAGGAGGSGGSVVAPPTKWNNATGNLANMASECGNLGLVSAKPASNMVIAGVAKAGLWSTVDGGKTWTKLGSGAGSAVITNRISTIIYDPTDANTFWESGIYNGGGVYKTIDGGTTFKQLGTVSHNDSLSIDLTDPARKTMLAGPHEASRKMFRSLDSGATWTDIGMALPGGSGFCTASLVLDAKNLLVGCYQGGLGIYRSADGGATFTSVSTKGALAQPMLAADGTIYWPGSQGGLLKSADKGMTFTQVADGNQSPGIIPPALITELPDKRVVIVGKDHLLASADAGATWKPIGDPLPFPGGGFDGAHGVTYSAMTKTFFIWRWDCSNSVPANAIMSSGFDYTTQ